MTSSTTIIVAGMIAGDPGQGGATWAVVQYVLGLQALGYEVVVVDPLPSGAVPPAIRAYFDSVVTEFGLAGHAALVPHEGVPYGLTSEGLRTVVRRTDVLVNLSGRWRDHDLLSTIPIRVFVDLDPAFTQLWHEQGAELGIAEHTHHVTVGAGLTLPNELLPTAGVEWHSMLPPVVLERWPAVPARRSASLTTVANWRSYGSIEHAGVHYGQKAHSFRRLDRLPSLSPVPIAVALSIHPGDAADRLRLEDAGWNLVDPLRTCGTPARYQAFVQRSWGEIGVAKAGYVTGRTGWVSDRTACYLASGRPVIIEDTCLRGVIPTGAGVHTFETAEAAAEAIQQVVTDYESNCLAARAIAEEHLSACRVLRRLMNMVMG